MILNAKSGICSEDCGYWSIGENERKQRYALVEPDKIKAGAQVATENHIGTYCIVMSGRGPTNRRLIISVRRFMILKCCIHNLKFAHV